MALTAVDRGRANAALTVLTRLGAAGNEEPLWRLIDERRSALAEVVLKVAQETGDPAGRVMAESLERRPDPVLCTRLEALLPDRTVALLELAVVVTVGADIIRGSRDEEHADQAREAHRKNNLGSRLSALGRREEALAGLSQTLCRHVKASG